MSAHDTRRAEVVKKPLLALTTDDLAYLTAEEYRWYLDHKRLFGTREPATPKLPIDTPQISP